MTGSGPCRNCGKETAPHELGNVVAEYDDMIVYEFVEQFYCECGQLCTELQAYTMNIHPAQVMRALKEK